MPKLLPKVEPGICEDTTQDTVLARTLKEIAVQKEKTLLKIAANQERAEERRHQETLALIKQIGNVSIYDNCYDLVFKTPKFSTILKKY